MRDEIGMGGKLPWNEVLNGFEDSNEEFLKEFIWWIFDKRINLRIENCRIHVITFY